ncbi:MAG: sugar phosphate nucleotidyltransferase [Syntrophobacteraceae bacterium]|jgi:NDP-sugar pyrophosphorylase family protein
MKMLPVAILAGGLATRLRSVTGKVPKSLVEVAGRPFIAHQLDLLKRNGIERIVLCVGYLGEMIYETIGNGEAFGIRVDYSNDGGTLLGTGGAVRKAVPLLGGAFFVLYGDSYLDCPYGDIQQAFEKSGKPALMTVFRNEGRWDESNILFRDGAILRYDKNNPTDDMGFIDYGLSVLTGALFTEIRRCEVFDLADVYANLVEKGEMAGYEVQQRFYEIGSHSGLEETRMYLQNRGERRVK